MMADKARKDYPFAAVAARTDFTTRERAVRAKKSA